MRLCERALNRLQIINEDGDVRLCSWQYDGGIIGRLTDNSLEEIYHSPQAELIRKRHVEQDFSNCNPDACPYVANDQVSTIEVEVDEVPRYPEELNLAFENTCNYRCVMCTIPDCMSKADNKVREEKYEKIDAELRKVLSHIKKIGANGLGELFASKHTLKLLSEWEPVAPIDECSVSLETNGSLFNEKNWEKISNLGKYNLSVAITILSFDEKIYQELSGTSLPLSNLIDNLHFVKSLREKGIINYLELATVYQDKNFRQLPEFTKRCLDEFNPDHVRLRPYEPWAEVTMAEWFKDVRNVSHPYHEEYIEIIKDPIFKHPKVRDGGAGKPSSMGSEPYPKMRERQRLLEGIFANDFADKIKGLINTKKVAIYGMSVVGKACTVTMKKDFEVAYCIDHLMQGQTYAGLPIYDTNHLSDKTSDTMVVICLDRYTEPVVTLLKEIGYKDVVTLREVV